MVLYIEPTGQMDMDVNLEYDFDSSNDKGIIQPPTINVTTAGGSGASAVFLFGSPTALFGTATFGGSLPKVYPKLLIGSW